MANVVQLSVAEGIATVTLDRPRARNALNPQMIDELGAALVDAEERSDVNVVILTGTDPAFCAGLDLHALSSGALDIGELTRRGRPWPHDHRKPWIGAVNGVAITGGLELALACDFIVASERARFADTHARLGILPFWGLTTALPQAVGMRAARLMSLTGNFIDAHEASRWGLVARVTPHDELQATARTLAQDVASNDQRAVQAIIRAYAASWGRPVVESMSAELDVALEWQGSGFRPEVIASRLDRVTARGRQQV
jgi:enoyl-CoA hydratase